MLNSALAERTFTMSRPLPTQPLRLHRFALSGHCHRVQLLLSLLELPFEIIDVDLASKEHKTPRFLALNPLGQVPVLEDGNLVLGDSNAILVYLAAAYGDGRFELRSPALLAEQQRWFSIAAGPLASGPAAARAQRLFRSPVDPASAQHGAHALLRVMDTWLAARPYLLGTELTLADVANYAYVAHAPEGGVALGDYPAVRAWLARIEAEPRFVPMKSTPIAA
jgi:glutathione S-transferase